MGKNISMQHKELHTTHECFFIVIIKTKLRFVTNGNYVYVYNTSGRSKGRTSTNVDTTVKRKDILQAMPNNDGLQK